ncbi:hypothetical protein HAX54_047533, partial [Datura stramonium]|nr:hypothetical protein [Datura stramonium]
MSAATSAPHEPPLPCSCQSVATRVADTRYVVANSSPSDCQLLAIQMTSLVQQTASPTLSAFDDAHLHP